MPIELGEAEEFLWQYHDEHPEAGSYSARMRAVRAEVASTGTYRHSYPELIYGAQVAWRNASRCVGRLYWRGLTVLDRRDRHTTDEICADLVTHLRVATGEGPRRGKIRAVISIFPPAVPGQGYPRVWNEQLVRYAGYHRDEGVIGDPRYLDFTSAVTDLGWTGKGGAFDVLPVVVETPTGGVRLFELPEDAVMEVPLDHPDYPWFGELGLRWHAVPAISNMRLTIGGVNYPLAPFNGWYLGTEIGARNLADADRYDMLPEVARRLGMNVRDETTLWRDRALVELNRAVLWSFQRAGARIADHHTETRRFLAHIEREAQAGRQTPTDWTWVVPPISGAATPVFHRYYHEADLKPNFYLDPVARDLGRLGRVEQSSLSARAPVCPVNGRSAPTLGTPRAVPVPGQTRAAEPTVPGPGMAAVPAVPGLGMAAVPAVPGSVDNHQIAHQLRPAVPESMPRQPSRADPPG